MKITYQKKTKLIILFILFIGGGLFAQVKISEESWTLPTYKVKLAEKAPIFYTGESFQGARRVIYPYALNDIISDEKQGECGVPNEKERRFFGVPCMVNN